MKTSLTPDQMRRKTQLERLAELQPLDIAIIGGGATGVGIALDAASRGYSVALFEQNDFGHGTSSRSTKLVHGGVRYLQQGNVSLVREALHERGLLLKNAPHVVHPLPTIIPLYRWWEGPYYATGIKAYDWLAGRLGIGRSRWLSKRRTLELAPTLAGKGLRGGVCYYDAQFDDTRLLINLVQAAVEHDAACLNYAPVKELMREQGRLTGLVAEDSETGAELRVRAQVIINAAGPFSDQVRRLEDTDAPRWIAASQGAHIVLPQRFLPGEGAVIVPRTPDGRVVFAIPWLGRVLVGTTDTPLDHAPREPVAMPTEVDFLLETIAPYLSLPIGRGDILSCFAGVRPLVQADPDASTSKLSRDHVIRVADSGLISVLGGKWTTYRRMAEDAVDRAIDVGDLPARPSATADLPIEPFTADPQDLSLEELVDQAVGLEMARTIEDVLSRRTRLLFRDAKQAAESAPRVAELIAERLNRDAPWRVEQVRAFGDLASRHSL